MAKRQIGPKVLNHPAMRTMKRNMREGGIAATEVYRIDGATPEEHLYFDVYSMRQWCRVNLPVVGTFVDWERAEHLVVSGAVDLDRIREHSLYNLADPIIIGVNGYGGGSDAVLDGGHRYVAAALAATAAGMVGGPVPLLAYFLEPDQWCQFLIPRVVAVAMRFDEHHGDGENPGQEAVLQG